jgi:hypothetical protein
VRVELISYVAGTGWFPNSFPDLDSEQTLVVVFGGAKFIDDAGPLEELSKAYPNSHILGCSTAGEILGSELRDDTLAVAITRFDHTKLVSTSIPTGTDSFQAGESIARALDANDTPKAVFVLSDGLSVNGSQLASSLAKALPEGVVLTGGLAADGDRFERTWVLSDGIPKTGTISAVGFYGEQVHIGHGSKGGWDMFGPERRVTRSEGNVLYELDDKPALQLYKEYLGERASGLPMTAFYFPLAIWEDEADKRRLVRTVLGVDEENNSLTFAGDIPQGCRAQLMKANFDRLVTGAGNAAKMTTANTAGNGDSETLAITVSCVGRRVVLGERTEEEIEAALDVLSKGTKQVGFYSYGELSPYFSGGCDLHNQTMTLTTFAER